MCGPEGKVQVQDSKCDTVLNIILQCLHPVECCVIYVTVDFVLQKSVGIIIFFTPSWNCGCM